MNDATKERYSISARKRSRRSVVQAYYQWLITKQPVSEIILEFRLDRNETQKADIKYFKELLNGMVTDRKEIEKKLTPFLDRPDKDLDPVENAVLHLGTYELLFQPDIPYKVVINEAIDLARMFGAEQSHKYINSVLDKLAHKHRQTEIAIR